MAEFRPIVVALILLGVLATAIITAGIQIANQNNPAQSIANDPDISSYAGSLNETLDSAYTDANASETAVSNSPITLTTGFIIFDAIGGIWKTMKAAPVAIYNLTAELFKEKILGSSAFYVVVGALSAILIITIVLAVWKLVSTGEGG